MTLFRTSKPAAAAQPTPHAYSVKRALVFPALAFVAVAGLAFLGLQKVSGVSSTAETSPTIIAEAACVSQLRTIAQDATIFFENGGAELTDSHLHTVHLIGEMVENCPEAVVYISGHSDTSGTPEAIMKLSWQRADNAIRAFESAGFDATQYEAIGFGARIPFAQGDVGEAEQERRVEFNVKEFLWETR